MSEQLRLSVRFSERKTLIGHEKCEEVFTDLGVNIYVNVAPAASKHRRVVGAPGQSATLVSRHSSIYQFGKLRIY